MKTIQEKIIDAAKDFIALRNEKLRLKKQRTEMLHELGNKNAHECCMEFDEGCYQAMRDGQLNDNTQFCDYCSKIHDVCIAFQSVTDKVSGKLRTLTNLVNRLIKA